MPAYQVYTGLLFGPPLAVTSFNRYSRFVEAAGRRLAWVMVSYYFDDSHLSDWASSKGSGQWTFRVLNELLGTPLFSNDKRQLMAATGTFLGLDFDMSTAMSHGKVAFFVRERLVTKVGDLVASILETRTLRSGLASKLYGMLNFLELGMFGRVGAGGLQRQFQLWWRSEGRMLAASDAAEDEPGGGSGGFHLVFFDSPQKRLSFVAEVNEDLYQLFQPSLSWNWP